MTLFHCRTRSFGFINSHSLIFVTTRRAVLFHQRRFTVSEGYLERRTTAFGCLDSPLAGKNPGKCVTQLSSQGGTCDLPTVPRASTPRGRIVASDIMQAHAIVSGARSAPPAPARYASRLAGHRAGSTIIPRRLDNNCHRLAKSRVPVHVCLLYTSPSPRDQRGSRMPSSA